MYGAGNRSANVQVKVNANKDKINELKSLINKYINETIACYIMLCFPKFYFI